jgi:hypothetical protein
VARAIRRLPRISVLLSELPGEDAVVWAVTPGDPLVEGLRWAEERGRRAILMDPDVRYRHHHQDVLPDPHVLWQMGPGPFVELIRGLAAAADAEPADALREKGMAFHILEHRAEIEGPMLCLVGAAHAGRLAERLGEPAVPPLARLHRSAVSLHHLHPESLTGLLPDPPLAHAVFEAIRNGELPAAVDFRETVSQRVELVREGLRLITGEKSDEAARRRHAVAAFAAHQACTTGPTRRPVPNRKRLARVIWQVAAASYEEQTREQTQPWQERLFFDFSRRCTRLRGQLVPSLYELVVAGRGVADDNLAWEVFDCARCYPQQEAEAELPTAKIDGDRLDLGTRKIRFRRRFFRTKSKPVLVPVKRRRQPDDPSEWLQGFSGDSICSYPPEDIVVEDYGRFLQQKAISILAAESARSEPFTTSMLDGVDIRETMRRWHENRVWVRELGRAPGAAGSVVVVFDDDLDTAGYPYHMTWLGEHEQESDMAFYATDPTQQIVGPGIMRATYGAFMLTYPPGRLFDVWHDEDYRHARTKADVLTMAGIDYSLEKNVVHVAKTPPGERLRRFASLQGKRLIHIPIGSLSPITIKKIRVVHILAGRDKREIAGDYVW